MDVVYLTIEMAIKTHGLTIEVSGGGATGVLDSGKLESVLFHIQNDDYYPTFVDKLTHLFFSSNMFHCFQDGNKRIAISLCAQMLLLNGYLGCIQVFLREMENISYHVAAGRIKKPLLHDLIQAVIYDELTSNEELKLRLLDAIRGDENTETEN